MGLKAEREKAQETKKDRWRQEHEREAAAKVVMVSPSWPLSRPACRRRCVENNPSRLHHAHLCHLAGCVTMPLRAWQLAADRTCTAQIHRRSSHRDRARKSAEGPGAPGPQGQTCRGPCCRGQSHCGPTQKELQQPELAGAQPLGHHQPGVMAVAPLPLHAQRL